MPVLDPPDPFDLDRTLGAAGVRGRWWTVHTDAGPATVALSHRRDGRLDVEAWGSGRDEALDRVPRLLGFDDDPEGFDPGPLRELHRAGLGLRLGATGAVFDALLSAILGQLVTSAEAKRSERRIRAAFGDPAPGPRDDLVLPPRPEVVADLGYEELHRFGVERKRAQVLIEAARRSRRLQEIMDMDRDAAYQRLTAVRGIGQWTAAMAMGIAWGDRDAVPEGDHNLPSMVTWVMRGERTGTDEEMLELLAPFRPNRRRAVMLLKQSGLHPPRHGPKTPVRDHL